MPSVSDYTAPGRFTDLSKCRKSLLQNLPSDTESLMQLVRGCVISPSQLRSGGLSVPTDRLIERNIRPAVEMIERLHDLFAAELTIRRPPELRLIGSCRHFATLTCALLRHCGVPARVRAGFAGYFESATYVDHWIIEHWNSANSRWVRADPQLSENWLQIRGQSTSELIATLQYFTGAQAWLGCRQGELDPARFRMGDENWGIGEVRGSVVLDFAALNKVEMLPWDCWGQMEAAYAGESDIAYDRFLDRVAEIAISDDYTLIADTYEASGDLRVPTQN